LQGLVLGIVQAHGLPRGEKRRGLIPDEARRLVDSLGDALRVIGKRRR
jgi:hypothetical protein